MARSKLLALFCAHFGFTLLHSQDSIASSFACPPWSFSTHLWRCSPFRSFPVDSFRGSVAPGLASPRIVPCTPSLTLLSTQTSSLRDLIALRGSCQQILWGASIRPFLPRVWCNRMCVTLFALSCAYLLRPYTFIPRLVPLEFCSPSWVPSNLLLEVPSFPTFPGQSKMGLVLPDLRIWLDAPRIVPCTVSSTRSPSQIPSLPFLIALRVFLSAYPLACLNATISGRFLPRFPRVLLALHRFFSTYPWR